MTTSLFFTLGNPKLFSVKENEPPLSHSLQYIFPQDEEAKTEKGKTRYMRMIVTLPCLARRDGWW
jgi:hypothetical protein